MSSTTKKIVYLVVIFAVILLGYLGYKMFSPPDYTSFATCLTEHNVIMYGTDWCPHCQNQKKMFGRAFKNVLYVNCDVSPICEEIGVKSYPTWSINGKLLDSGVKELEVLSRLSDCELPTS